jgi:hypothetical protein
MVSSHVITDIYSEFVSDLRKNWNSAFALCPFQQNLNSLNIYDW